MNGALEGLRAVEVGGGISGSFCALLIAGFGGEVIKIVPPSSRERGGAGPEGENPLAEESSTGLFAALNRGKMSVSLDSTKAVGRQILIDLAAQCDVLIMSHLPNQAQQPEVPLKRLSQANPRMIVTSASNFGLDGPYASYLADELILDALGGFVYGIGEPGKEPLGCQGIQSQVLAGACAYFGTLVALISRDRNGDGQSVDVSIQETLATLLESSLTLASYSGWIWRRSGRHRAVAYHPISNYPCRDGYLNISILEDYEWRSFCELLGAPQLASDPRFSTARDRLENADEIDGLIGAWLQDRSCDEIYHEGQARRIACGPVNTIKDVIACRQLESREFFTELTEGPASLKVTRPPFKMGRTKWNCLDAPHGPGEDNGLIYEGLLGYDADFLGQLQREGII